MKKYVIGFILGALLFSGIGVAAYALLSSDVQFTPNNNNWQVGNVEDALNSLYISRANNDYSTDEKVVGKWIDDRLIYSKVLTLNISNNADYTFDAKELIATDIDIIISATGYSVVDSGTTIANFPCYYTSAAFLSEWMNYNTKLVHIIAGAQYKTGIHYINFTYTKTTD